MFALKGIDWKATLLIHFIRGSLSGIGFFILILLVGGIGDPMSPIRKDGLTGVVAILLGLPFLYLLFLLPLSFIATYLGSGKYAIPFVGLLALPATVFGLMADPFVFIIHKIKKEIIPVEKYGFFNWKLMIVYRDGVLETSGDEGQESMSNKSSVNYAEEVKKGRLGDNIFPFGGTRLDHLQGKFGNERIELRNNGEIYSKDAIGIKLGYIDDDGTVYDTRGLSKKVGRVDEDGRIRDY